VLALGKTPPVEQLVDDVAVRGVVVVLLAPHDLGVEVGYGLRDPNQASAPETVIKNAFLFG
jgi:hypothetical protein